MIENDHVVLWGRCLNLIRDNVPETTFKTWFEPIVPLKYEDKALTIDQPLYADDIKVSSFDVYDGSLIVNLNKNILASNRTVKQNVYNALVLSLAALPGIEKVEVRVDGVTISPKDQKEDMVSVYALTYNEVQF